jgi:hypothetical protein
VKLKNEGTLDLLSFDSLHSTLYFLHTLAMPLCTLHLIRLQHEAATDGTKRSPHAKRVQFLQRLLRTSLAHRIIMASVVRRPVIVANRVDPVFLNATRWDLLLVIGPEKGNPSTSNAQQEDAPIALTLQDHPQTKADVSAEYIVDVGIPTKVLDSYAERTKKLKENAAKADKPSLPTSPARAHPGYSPKTSQLLEMSDDLAGLINELDELKDSDGLADAHGPVCQLNLLKFKKSKEDKERYHKSGQVRLSH